ncbi:MAG: ROK family protein [Candidatus Omnitrophica bacterium]|nr:ROK family protein [Candidatus Omnitrophota bacterium]MBU4472974.1 ROK family protein [Candidatus Omnitrophota bacterium]MCG2706996.1 ROK family protein [Candidatus Omnitrophota bacterium]
MAKKFIIGVDLGGTNLKIALLDLKYRIKDKNILSTQVCLKKENLISTIADAINKIIENNRIKRTDILGIGLGLPGPVDIKRGLVHFLPNIAGYTEVNFAQILKRRLGLPVSLDNDANLMCLAEYKLGAAKGFKNIVCLTLGTGVGGGIIIEGKLYRGSNDAGGEIGHIPINERGPRCNCGGIACLETYIGNNSILREARRLFRRDISLEELSSLAKKPDKRAQALWSKIGGRLGVALVGVVNLLNPDCIVIGGGVAGAGKILFARLREVISRQAMSVQSRHLKIVKARLGNNAGLIGAAILVKERVRL